MQVTNPELKELDKKVAEFYKLSRRYINRFINIYGKDIYKSELSDILKSLDKINPESRFDELILKNIRSNININDLVIDYFVDQDFPLSINKFVTEIAGTDAWLYLEENTRLQQLKLKWDYDSISDERNKCRISPFTAKVKKLAEAYIPKIKKDILNYGISKGHFDDKFNLGLLLISPKEGEENSWWDSETNTCNLAFENFRFYYKNGEISVAPMFAYQTAFHEVIGHATHQIHSDNLPLTVRFSNEIGYITPTKSIIEGFAKNKESGCYEFLKRNLQKLNISKEDVQLLETNNIIKNQTFAQDMYLALNYDKHLKDKDFDAFKHILELTNNPITAKLFKENFKMTFRGMWYLYGHTFGNLHYQKMLDRVKKEFGDDYPEKENKKFNIATARGVWSWEVYPEAVCYFLENP